MIQLKDKLKSKWRNETVHGNDWFKPGIFSFRSELHSGQ